MSAQRITRFTKIRYDGSKVRLEYQVTRPHGDPDEFAISSSDQPLTAFIAALRALVVDVMDICEFPHTERDKFRVRGVSLSYHDGVMGACITALKDVLAANSPLVINTPFLPEKGEECCLSPRCAERIRELVFEAARYRDGERAQGALFGPADAQRLNPGTQNPEPPETLQ